MASVTLSVLSRKILLPGLRQLATPGTPPAMCFCHCHVVRIFLNSSTTGLEQQFIEARERKELTSLWFSQGIFGLDGL